MKYSHLFVLGFAGCVLACGAMRSSNVQAPVELTITPIGSAKLSAALPLEQPSGTCTLTLKAARIEKSAPGCYLDEHISHEPGLLKYPCGGDGPAEADFGTQHYKGKVDVGELQLELTTELDWNDGCRWGTAATISGSITDKAGTPTLKKLVWRYQDHVISGRDCSGVCDAHTSFDVSSKNPSRSSPGSDKPGTDEDGVDYDD
jgi:hypothetical protein